MSAVEAALYKWIIGANERREVLSLPPGLIEDSCALLLEFLGREYLDHLLVSGSEPISLSNPEANPLKMWLKSAAIDHHIVQALELAAYLRTFKGDPALPDKIEKLKRDRFWPIFFELAMAARVKSACQDSQSAILHHERSDTIGDFSLGVGGTSTPCECSRLGHSPQVSVPSILAEQVSHRIADATKRVSIPLIFKIRSSKGLSGDTFNVVLRLLRRCLADIKRSHLPTVHYDGPTSVCCGELTEHSEKMPFAVVDGVVTNVTGADWDNVNSLQRVPAENEEEMVERFKSGERFRRFEAVRLFMKFGLHVEIPDPYRRLTNKLKKKLRQTKVEAGSYGRLVFIEVPFDLRLADKTKLSRSIAEAVQQSRNTLGVVLANREANPHHRHHYSMHGSLSRVGFALKPELVSLFERFQLSDTRTDLITGLPYQYSWQEALDRSEADMKASE